jgi:hypothetical protein
MMAGIFAVRVERQVLGRALIALAEVDKMDLIRQTDLFQHDRDLHAIRRRQGIELQPVRMLGRPTLYDGKTERSVIPYPATSELPPRHRQADEISSGLAGC